MKQNVLERRMYDVAKLLVISLVLGTSNNTIAMNNVNRNLQMDIRQHNLRMHYLEQGINITIQDAKELIESAVFLKAQYFFANTKHDLENNSIKQNMRNVSDIFTLLFTTIASSLSAFGKNADAFSYISAIPNPIIHLLSFVNNATLGRDTNKQKFKSCIKIFSNIAYITGTASKKVQYIVLGNICDTIFSISSYFPFTKKLNE